MLTDLPAADDAQDVERMPGSLRYTSASSPETVQAFFEFLGLPARTMHALTEFPEMDILPIVKEPPV